MAIDPDVHVRMLIGNCVRGAKVVRSATHNKTKKIPALNTDLDAHVPDEVARDVLRALAKHGYRITKEGTDDRDAVENAGLSGIGQTGSGGGDEDGRPDGAGAPDPGGDL